MTKRKIFFYIILFLAVIFPLFSFYTSATPTDDTNIGIINYQKVIQVHPNWDQLANLQEKIEQLNQKQASLDQLIFSLKEKDFKAKMQAEQKRLQVQFSAEVKALEKKIQEQHKLFQKQLMTEAESVRARINANRAKQRPPQALFNQIQKQMRDELAQNMKEYFKTVKGRYDKLIDKDREILKKQFSTIVAEEKRLIASKMTARFGQLDKKIEPQLIEYNKKQQQEFQTYQQQVLKSTQEQKINLSLKINSATTDEEKNTYRQQMNEIMKKETALINKKKEEQMKKVSDYRQILIKGSQKEIESYHKEFSDEANVRINKKKAFYDKVMQKKAAEYQNQVHRLMKEREAVLKTKMESKYKARLMSMANQTSTAPTAEEVKMINQLKAKQAQIEAQLKKESMAAAEKLKKRRDELNSQLQGIAQQMQKNAATENDDLSRIVKSKKESNLKEINELKQKARDLQKMMKQDIAVQLNKLLKEDKINIVLISYYYNNTGIDLTDKVIKLVKEIKQ